MTTAEAIKSIVADWGMVFTVMLLFHICLDWWLLKTSPEKSNDNVAWTAWTWTCGVMMLFGGPMEYHEWRHILKPGTDGWITAWCLSYSSFIFGVSMWSHAVFERRGWRLACFIGLHRHDPKKVTMNWEAKYPLRSECCYCRTEMRCTTSGHWFSGYPPC